MKRVHEKSGFEAHVCPSCGQTTEVEYPLDRGTSNIVKALAAAVKRKGVNEVHVRKEMEVGKRDFSYDRMIHEGVVTSSMTQNWIRAHKHGLVAMVKGKRGVWCLTRKGAAFLRGEPVAKYAVQDKLTKHNKGLWRPEEFKVTVRQLSKSDEYWEGIDFDIDEGNVIMRKELTFEGAQQELF